MKKTNIYGAMVATLQLFLLTSCNDNQSNQPLISFTILRLADSSKIYDTAKDRVRELGSLWVQFNKINTKRTGDTLIVNVNAYVLNGYDYEGSCLFRDDTLFLFAKTKNKSVALDTSLSELTYKLSTLGHSYKTIDFKESR